MGNAYNKSMTSRELTETKDDFGIGAAIRSATTNGKRWRDNPGSLVEGLPRPSMLERGGLALQAGIQAGAKAPYESGWANLLSGIGTGIQSGMAYDQMLQEQALKNMQMQQANIDFMNKQAATEMALRQQEAEQELYNMPVGQLSPALTELGLGEFTVGQLAKLNAILPSLMKQQIADPDIISDSNKKVALDVLKRAGVKENEREEIFQNWKGQKLSQLSQIYKIPSAGSDFGVPISLDDLRGVAEIYNIPLNALMQYIGTNDRRPLQNIINTYARTRIEKANVIMGANAPTAISYKTMAGIPKKEVIPNAADADKNLGKLVNIREKLMKIYDRVIDYAGKSDKPFTQAVNAYINTRAGAEYRALISNAESLIPGLTKGYMQEVGNLAEKEQQRAAALLPQWTPTIKSGFGDSLESLMAKKELIKEMFSIGEKLEYSRAINGALTMSLMYDDSGMIYNSLLSQYQNNPVALNVLNVAARKLNMLDDSQVPEQATGGNAQDGLNASTEGLDAFNAMRGK